jgi:hypothetical protein
MASSRHQVGFEFWKLQTDSSLGGPGMHHPAAPTAAADDLHAAP